MKESKKTLKGDKVITSSTGKKAEEATGNASEKRRNIHSGPEKGWCKQGKSSSASAA